MFRHDWLNIILFIIIYINLPVELSTKLVIFDDDGENKELDKIPTRDVRHPVISRNTRTNYLI